MKITLLLLCLFVHFLSILGCKNCVYTDVPICNFFFITGGSDKDKVLLEKVSAITLEEGKMTNARRTSAIPQV